MNTHPEPRPAIRLVRDIDAERYREAYARNIREEAAARFVEEQEERKERTSRLALMPILAGVFVFAFLARGL